MFLSAIERRGLESAIGDASAYGRWLVTQYGDTWSGAQVTENTALTLTYAYACIKVLSETLASVPLELLRMGPDGPEQVTDHPLAILAGRTPSDRLTSFVWRNTLEGHRNGWGNCYCRIIRKGGRPVALEILEPDRTQAGTLDSGDVVYRTAAKNSRAGYEQIPAVDVFHVAGLGFDGLAGYSPVQLAKQTIGLGLAVHQFGASFFKNGATTKGVLESDLPANTITKWAAEFKAMFGGLDQSHGTPVLPKGVTYKPTTINPDDAQTLETLKFNRTEVAALYRVPPQFIMDLERSTFTNAVEMDLHFLKHTMTPIFTNWEQELDRKLLTTKEREQGFYFRFNGMGLLRGDPTTRYAAYHTALQDGWLSRNEVRRMEDRISAPGLDEHLVPNNMVTPSKQDPAAIVEAASDRLASAERRFLERAQPPERVAEFYQGRFPDMIRRHVRPLAVMLTPAEVEQSTQAIVEQYLERVMRRHADADQVDADEIRQVIEGVLIRGT